MCLMGIIAERIHHHIDWHSQWEDADHGLWNELYILLISAEQELETDIGPERAEYIVIQ